MTPISIPLPFQIQPITIIIDKNIPVPIRQEKRTKQEKRCDKKDRRRSYIFWGSARYICRCTSVCVLGLCQLPKHSRLLSRRGSLFCELFYTLNGVCLIIYISLRLAFFPQIVPCVSYSGYCHPTFLEKRLARKSCSTNCYCLKGSIEHYYQLVLTKSIRCLDY